MTGFSSFKDLKKNRGELRKKIEAAVTADGKTGGGARKEDENSWYPIKNDQGSCSTLIRFLPPSHGQTLPWAKRYRHAFKENGKWLFENCPTTHGNDCPICDANKELWQTEIESNRKIASARKRQLEYFYNIHIIDDNTQEGVTGTNKIFKSGPYVFKMIQSALNPEFADDAKVDAFDLWEGADFNFKMFIKDKQLTYERSAFKAPSEFASGDDEKQEAVYNGMYDLGVFTDNKLFNSYEDIKKNFLRVTGAVDKGVNRPSAEKEVKKSIEEKSIGASDLGLDTSESDDALAMFESLADS